MTGPRCSIAPRASPDTGTPNGLRAPESTRTSRSGAGHRSCHREWELQGSALSRRVRCSVRSKPAALASGGRRNHRVKLFVPLVAAALLVVGVPTAAHADTWKYPGRADCAAGAQAMTYTETKGGTGTQHRVTGYAGYWYANWGPTTSITYRVKEWGFQSAWDARLGTLGSGGTVQAWSIGCVT